MTQFPSSVAEITKHLRDLPHDGRRRLVAIAGAPASGKSTLAGALSTAMNDAGYTATALPMDGFHLDNAVLIDRGLLHRKGAPETFDVHGFVHLVARLRDDAEIIFPTFDRARDIAVAGSGCVGPDCDTVIVEGNYLLFDAPAWRDLAVHWDLSVFVDVPFQTLRDRLIARWVAHGLSTQNAETRAAENDLANARRICDARLTANLIL